MAPTSRVRMSSESWFKLQDARTEGLITSTYRSTDGGFGFSGYDDAFFQGVQDAGGYRADVSVGLNDVFARTQGRVTLYKQELDAGYSARLPEPERLEQLRRHVPDAVDDRSCRSTAKARPQRCGAGARDESAQEIDVLYQLNERWGVSTGVRDDLRIDRSPVVPLTQEQGDRKDAVVQAEYDSKGRWSAYGFVQDTLSVTGDREENGRVGTGGSYRFSREAAGQRGSVGRRSRRGRQPRHALHAERAHDRLHELRARERERRGRPATGRGRCRRRQPDHGRQDAALGQHERLSRGALPERELHVGPHALDGRESRPDAAPDFQREHRHRHPHGHADRRRRRSAKRAHSAPATARAPSRSRAVSSTARTTSSSPTCRSRRATRGCSGATSSTSSAKRRAWSASSTTRTARARSGSSTTAATRKPFSVTRSARCATTG